MPEPDLRGAIDAIDARFHDVWWTCGICHAAFPRDFEDDYCPDHDVRLRRNDDVRIARQQATDDAARRMRETGVARSTVSKRLGPR